MAKHHVVEIRRPQYAVALHTIVMGAAQSRNETQSVHADVIPLLRIVVVVVDSLVLLLFLLALGGVVNVRLGIAVGGPELRLLVGIWIHAVRMTAGPPAFYLFFQGRGGGGGVEQGSRW